MKNMPGEHQSLWMATTPETHYSPLLQDIETDVAVVGGGLVGLMTALLLQEAGYRVTILEANRIAAGVSGHTTAKITSLHRRIYHSLIESSGREKAQLYGEANQTAIALMGDIAQRHQIACDWLPQSAYTFAQTDEHVKLVEEEARDAASLGLPATFVKDIPLPVAAKGAVRFDNQAQFHPRKYMLGLAERVTAGGGQIYEETRVTGVACEGEGPCRLELLSGHTVRAKEVVVATNFPIHDRDGFYFLRLEPSMSYALALRMRGRFPGGMYLASEDSGHSFRSQPMPDGGEEILVLDGTHRVGQGGDTLARYRKLMAYARGVFDVTSIDYWWSTQDCISLDQVPYIGHLTEGHKHVYVATGFKKWGMTHSTVAAVILTELVQGREHRWLALYTPSRFKVTGRGAELALEGLGAQKNLLKRILPEPHIELAQLAPGEGRVGSLGGAQAGVYKDEQGQTYAVNPVCRHMGCLVEWNNAERSWDCPCHGSRYTFKGRVIHSPTVHDLNPAAQA